jgi:hypothetical protein
MEIAIYRNDTPNGIKLFYKPIVEISMTTGEASLEMILNP